MDTPQHCSWTWRSLLKYREVFLPMIQYPVNARAAVSFWNDPWVSNGQILSKIRTYSQIIQTGIHIAADANDFLHNSKIQLPYCSNHVIQQIWSDIQQITFSDLQNDTVLWHKKAHSVKEVYKFLTASVPLPASKWFEVIWSIDSVPKDNLMMWKVLNSALLTRSLLHKFGMACSTQCLFCELHEETTDHIYFECPALQHILDKIGGLTGINLSGNTSRILWSIIYKATKWRTKHGRVLAICLKVYMTVIWSERNAIVFENVRRNDDVLWNEVKGRTYKQLKNSVCIFPQTLINVWA